MIGLAQGALRGSFVPLVTPFVEGRVDYEGFAGLVDFQRRGGSQGIVVTGTTGEPSTLTAEERVELFRVARECAGGLQVVAATGAQDHATTCALTDAARGIGVDAVLIVTPYFARPPERGLEAYFVDLCRRSELPTMIYHIPGRAAVGMSPASIARVAERSPNLVGVKHASQDLAFVTDVLRLLGCDFRVHVGLEEMSFPMLCIGAAGLMNAVGNVAPGAVAGLAKAVAEGALDEGRRRHFELHELNQAVFFDINPIPMKYMMLSLGLLATEDHRAPMASSTPDLRARLDAVLANAAPILAHEPIAGTHGHLEEAAA